VPPRSSETVAKAATLPETVRDLKVEIDEPTDPTIPATTARIDPPDVLVRGGVARVTF